MVAEDYEDGGRNERGVKLTALRDGLGPRANVVTLKPGRKCNLKFTNVLIKSTTKNKLCTIFVAIE